MKKCIFLSIAVLNLVFPASVKEASDSLERDMDRAGQEIMRNERERINKERESTEFFQPILEDRSVEMGNTVLFMLKKVTVTDVEELLTQNEEHYLRKKYLYREVGVREVNMLINEANAILVRKGYITSRVSADTGKIAEGELILRVTAGKIGKVRLNEGKFSDSLKIFFSRPSRKSGILNIRDIDTMTDNFNRNPSNNFSVNIVPSDQEGYSDIVAENKVAGKTTLSLGYDNHGDEGGGKNRLKIGLNIESPLGINDILSMHIQGVSSKKPDRSWKSSSALLQPGQIAPTGPFPGYDPDIHGLLPPQRETSVWSISYRIPIRSYIFSVSGHKSMYRRSTYSYNTVYDLSGSSTSLEAGLSRILYRDGKGKLVGNIGVRRKNIKSYFEDVKLVDRNLSIGSIGLNYDFTFLRGVAGLGISYSKGLMIFHSERDEGKGSSIPKSSSERINMDFYWYRPMNSFTFRLSGEIQKSEDINYGSEKISAGGIGNVPGYHYDNISGDSGYWITGELSYTFKYGKQRLTPYISYGIGETVNNHDSSEYRLGKVKGGSIGLRFSSTYVDVDVSYGKAFSHSSYLQPKDHEIYGSVVLKYSF